MSALERTPRKPWPGLAILRRVEVRKERLRAKRAIRTGRDDLAVTQHRHSAKWQIW